MSFARAIAFIWRHNVIVIIVFKTRGANSAVIPQLEEE
jgi:hypothetical protein